MGSCVSRLLFTANDYHLEIETPHGQLSRVMQWINRLQAVYVNLRYDRVDH